MTAATDADWELDVHSKKMRTWLISAAGVVLVVFVAAALVLRGGGDTGVNLRPADQFAVVVIGFVLAGATLMFSRARVRAGASGVAVRNVFGEKTFSWDEVRGLTFPEGKPWARLELPHDEYMPVVALQPRDGQHAVDATDRFRRLEARYGRAVGDAD
ncbi:PH domain-containing protein [Rhodococcus phenolicus]|uniref:PH domain-containing protein n=1 Tax=Rhodococcus phenolicus TaxID=263849 RepID=UPI0009EE5A22|nr:PH domain-containing protein [Rhodococcus phenolicus]